MPARKKHLGLPLAVLVLLSACTGARGSACLPGPGPAGAVPSLAPRPAVEERPTQVLWLVPREWTGLQPVLDAFQAENPDLKVEAVPVAAADLLGVTTALLRDQGTGPDILTLREADTPYLAKGNLLEPLWNVLTFDQKQDWLINSRLAGTYQHEQYSAPLAVSTQLLFYNLDLLSAAHIAPPGSQERWSWEKVAQVAARLTRTPSGNGGAGVWGFAWEGSEVRDLLALPESLRGPLPGERGGVARGVIDSSAWAKAFTFYRSMYAAGVAPPEPGFDAAASFARGELALFAGSAEWIERFGAPPSAGGVAFQWGAARYPRFAGGRTAVPNATWSLAVAAGSLRKDQAIRFVTWVTGGKGAELFWQDVGAGLPAQKSLLGEIEKLGVGACPTGEPLSIAAEEASLETLPIPDSTDFPAYEQVLGEGLREIRGGSAAWPVLHAAAMCLDQGLQPSSR